jgi:nucleotide-binding universal stress UspA family protein
MQSILVGLDGSDDCSPAIDLGINWAKRFDSLLVGIGVVDEPAIRGYQPEGHVSSTYQLAYDQLLSTTRRDVEQTLERFSIRCSEEQVSFKLLEDEGQPCERILTELQRYDLLILGCKTHFRHAGDQHPCHTLENVLRAASRPVVVAPRPTEAASGEGVVVAYDGSMQAARALYAFLATGLAGVAPIHIVSVHPDSSVEAARIADRAAEFLRFHDIESARVPMVGSSASRSFLHYAQEQNAELLVMGAYGQAKVKEFFFGSATCTALQESSVPLFLFH